ncbi:hypothetical protein [Shinella sp. BYT-45]|uniref:hypothetical protein n=1 Tax=Shinella sp. BYT-45 TaxID=3377377 RepID=UPI00398024CE
MSRISKARSKAPTKGAAAIAATSENAAVETVDAAATPPGSGVPGGTNTTASESGAAAGKASAEQVKPHDKDGPSTPGIVPDATNSQSAPEAEAAASGGSEHDPDASQGAAASGAGNPAGPAGALRIVGVDLALAEEFTVVSWGAGLSFIAEDFPRTYAFLAAAFSEKSPKDYDGGIHVSARTNGFRRGGIAHSTAGTLFPLAEISPAQLEAFLGEPELTVELV